MGMYYTRLRATCPADFTEILIAETAEAGFDTFMETAGGFEAFAEQDNFDRTMLDEIRSKYAVSFDLTFSLDRVEKENWNEQWERSFEPVIVGDDCIVRAEFHHPDRTFPYEIIVTPKMSFGTGHHPTTWLMLHAQLSLDHIGKQVMDAGCGTAILSIMAEKRGAAHVEAFDIDEWSAVNGQENLQNNYCSRVRLRQGTVRSLDLTGPFEIILANINKNVLLDEMDEYSKRLKAGGHLVLSGFYESDAADLLQSAGHAGFIEVSRESRDSWCCLFLKKKV